MTNLIYNYRDFKKGTRFRIHGHRITEAAGFLLKGIPGSVFVLERVFMAVTATDTTDANDNHNVRLTRTNSDGAPAAPVLTATVTAGTSTTVFDTGLTMTLDAHAGRQCLFVTGNNKSARGIYQCRTITGNTTGGEITLSSALTGTPDAGDKFVIMPANMADTAWSQSTLKTLLPQMRLLRVAGGRTGIFQSEAIDMPLGVGEGIGWFCIEHDNYLSTEDLVKFTEVSIDIEGRIEGAGWRSQETTRNFQPAST